MVRTTRTDSVSHRRKDNSYQVDLQYNVQEIQLRRRQLQYALHPTVRDIYTGNMLISYLPMMIYSRRTHQS
jgi:hypothetical protein